MKKLLGIIVLCCAILFLPNSTYADEIFTKEKLITVDTSKQTLTAWENGQIVYQTAVSTGLSQSPTVKGSFSIYTKIPNQAHMKGFSPVHGYYDLPNVMYFTGGYGIHGAYWHNNFGRPMSNGCVNVPLKMAHTLFTWAPVGTRVEVY